MASSMRKVSPFARRFAAALTLLLSACWWTGQRTADPSDPLVPGTTTAQRVSTHDGTRRFVLHVPPAPPRRFGFARPYPLLLLLHGSSADGKAIEEQSGMDSIADRYHMVVAYPEGARSILGRSSADWNAGECCGYAQHNHVDDVDFLRAVITDLSARLSIDQRRIYVGGFSDGGRMAYRAGCEMSDRVAAIAVVSGSLQLVGCAPARPVSLIAVHGTADSDVPYSNAVPGSDSVAALPGSETTPPSVRYWARAENCRTFRSQRVAPSVVRGDFGGCAGAALTLLTFEGGTHRWPERIPPVDATEMIARFLLAQHR